MAALVQINNAISPLVSSHASLNFILGQPSCITELNITLCLQVFYTVQHYGEGSPFHIYILEHTSTSNHRPRRDTGVSVSQRCVFKLYRGGGLSIRHRRPWRNLWWGTYTLTVSLRNGRRFIGHNL